jgi:hypothetical protein
VPIRIIAGSVGGNFRKLLVSGKEFVAISYVQYLRSLMVSLLRGRRGLSKPRRGESERFPVNLDEEK